MTRVFVALGSNLGRREDYLSAALVRLGVVLDGMRASGVYESAPMYVEEQPAFLNMVVEGQTEAGPFEVLRELKRIEGELGRQERERNGPREIDLDLVVYGALVLRSVELVVPHPRLAERRFVLEPLAELDEAFVVPRAGRVRDLRRNAALGSQEIRRVPDAEIRLSGV